MPDVSNIQSSTQLCNISLTQDLCSVQTFTIWVVLDFVEILYLDNSKYYSAQNIRDEVHYFSREILPV